MKEWNDVLDRFVSLLILFSTLSSKKYEIGMRASGGLRSEEGDEAAWEGGRGAVLGAAKVLALLEKWPVQRYQLTNF